MINVQDIPAVRELLEQAHIEQEASDLAPQYARAPAGDGHEAALKQRSGQQ